MPWGTAASLTVSVSASVSVSVSVNAPLHGRIIPSNSLFLLKQAGLDLREKITEAIAQVDEKLNLDDISEMDDVEKLSMQKLIRETLHQCYNFGFEVNEYLGKKEYISNITNHFII